MAEGYEHIDDEDLELTWAEVEDCPNCRGLAFPMGKMGWTEWYRCQECGWEFTV